MKTFIVLSFLVAVYLQVDGGSIIYEYEELPEGSQDMMLQSFLCRRELGAHKLRNIPTNIDWILTEYPEDNDSVNALWDCIFKKKGMLNDNSEVNQDKLQEYFVDVADVVRKTFTRDLQLVHSMTEECSSVRGHDSGQTAVKIQNCAVQYALERNLRK